MIYPPKKRAYSPEPAVTKDLSHLININSKFAGSGGSTYIVLCRHVVACTQKAEVHAEGCCFGSLQGRKVRKGAHVGSCLVSPPSSASTTIEAICPLQSASKAPPARYSR